MQEPGARRGGTTPHTLRRTFASVLVALGEDPSYVMEQMGHTDSKFTLSVYAHAMRRKHGEREELRASLERLVGRDTTPTTGEVLAPVLTGLRDVFRPVVQEQMAAEVLAPIGTRRVRVAATVMQAVHGTTKPRVCGAFESMGAAGFEPATSRV